SLEADGFMVARTEFAAQKLSIELAEKIKNQEVKGTRGFSGEYFIIDSELYHQKSKTVLEFLKAKKSAALEELKSSLKLPPTLIKIICTFLSEDGLILERRKEQYQYIE
ncbi:MAG: hypothetical protein HYW50_02425, partial [Candidatus Diapherotrites archaeon]|nr:hypothetical protein [Candidatus Diapherotrites archaeon]